MKLLVDMNLSPRWVDLLADAGIEAAHWPHTLADARWTKLCPAPTSSNKRRVASWDMPRLASWIGTARVSAVRHGSRCNCRGAAVPR
jgi:predicted nuclease of predicted toxin-antitoxin system